MDKPQLLFLLDGAGYRVVSGGSYEPGGGGCSLRSQYLGGLHTALRLDPDTGLLVVILFLILSLVVFAAVESDAPPQGAAEALGVLELSIGETCAGGLRILILKHAMLDPSISNPPTRL